MSTAPTNASPTTSVPRGAVLTTVQVVFRRIVVSKISDPGSNAEVAFTFTVNGQTAPFVHNDLRLGITAINRTIVTAVDPGAALRIAVRGVEKDTTSGDDVLPASIRTFTAEQRFGEGSHRVEASNSHELRHGVPDPPAHRFAYHGHGHCHPRHVEQPGPGAFTVPLAVGLFFDDSRTAGSVTSFPPITVESGDRLVGAATFDVGFLDNEQANLVVDGELADLP